MNVAGLGATLRTKAEAGLLRLRSPLTVAVIGFVLVSSAVAVAYSAHKSRLYLNDLQQLEIERDHLETEWGQLLLEQHTWGAYGRVGKIALEQLQMRNPAPTEIIMVRQ